MLRCTLWFKKGFLIPVSSLCPFTLCCKSCSVKRQSIDFLKILNTNHQYKVRNVAELQPRVESLCCVFGQLISLHGYQASNTAKEI